LVSRTEEIKEAEDFRQQDAQENVQMDGEGAIGSLEKPA